MQSPGYGGIRCPLWNVLITVTSHFLSPSNFPLQSGFFLKLIGDSTAKSISIPSCHLIHGKFFFQIL